MKKKLGIGSLSLVLVIIAIFWCCNIHILNKQKENNTVNVQEQKLLSINGIQLDTSKITTIVIEKNFLLEGEETQIYTLNQEEIYTVMNILQNLYFTEETCDGIPEYLIRINIKDSENSETFSIERYSNEVHILSNSDEAVLTEEQSNEIKRIIGEYFNK